MNSLQELVAHYNFVDRILEDQRRAASGNPQQQGQVELRQKINDQAYFVLCWGQLEAALDDACRSAIRKRRDNPDWSKRRAWDLYNPEDKRLSGLSFEERVTLVLDKKSQGGEWKLVIKWYELRSRIAHGGTHEQRIDLNLVAAEFYQIQSKIET